MCGIVGVLGTNSSWPEEEIRQSILDMTAALTHRGPDDAGVWLNKSQHIAIGHRRLAVLDLSAAGHQPMHSPSGRFVLAFNGEIYNHLDLREELQKAHAAVGAWKGHSDTETLLAGFDHWGIEDTIQRAVGMFAMAIWDRHERRLILVRDRMGEKPLYFGWSGSDFLFASELKALRQFPGFSAEISRDVLALFLRYAYVPAPYSIYKNIYKLEPGCMMELDLTAAKQMPNAAPCAPATGSGWRIRRFWALAEHLPENTAVPTADEQQSLEQLEAALLQSVRSQLLSDVPLGAFLSGGVDSSLMVALMGQCSSQRVKTFTIGFGEAGYSEAPYARAVADHLQTDHTELRVSAAQAMDVIPRLPQIYDEPFADSSQIPTFLVAQLARQHVTVALSGDGGDEMFGGYNRYTWAPRIWSKIGFLPLPLRRALGPALVTSSRWAGGLSKRLNSRLPRHLVVALADEKLEKLGQRLGTARDVDEFYLDLLTAWNDPESIVRGAKEPDTLLSRREEWPNLAGPEQRMMYLDAMTYLPDDILCKVDRAAMAVSLETRVPLLDHRVVELAWRLPLSMKIRGGDGKWALRQILYKHVPGKLIERPKQGFAIPLGDWLRGSLREWAESLLQYDRIAREGCFEAEPIRRAWAQHLSGKRNWEHALWPVLMFQCWLEEQRGTG